MKILKIELVPKTSWYTNLRNILPEKWDEIRRESYKKANYKCEICGVKEHLLECHEVWEYDAQKYIQKLVGLEVLCSSCHMVKHAGLAQHQGKLSKVIGHLAAVNHWDVNEAIEHVDQAFKEWMERSKLSWEIDISLYKE